MLLFEFTTHYEQLEKGFRLILFLYFVLHMMFFHHFIFQIESEENVLICLRIIIELHKQFRPPISQEVRIFLSRVSVIF